MGVAYGHGMLCLQVCLRMHHPSCSLLRSQTSRTWYASYESSNFSRHATHRTHQLHAFRVAYTWYEMKRMAWVIIKSCIWLHRWSAGHRRSAWDKTGAIPTKLKTEKLSWTSQHTPMNIASQSIPGGRQIKYTCQTRQRHTPKHPADQPARRHLPIVNMYTHRSMPPVLPIPRQPPNGYPH